MFGFTRKKKKNKGPNTLTPEEMQRLLEEAGDGFQDIASNPRISALNLQPVDQSGDHQVTTPSSPVLTPVPSGG